MGNGTVISDTLFSFSRFQLEIKAEFSQHTNFEFVDVGSNEEQFLVLLSSTLGAGQNLAFYA